MEPFLQNRISCLQGSNQMILRALGLAGLLALLVGGSCRAASFDCAKADSADEKAICADRIMDDQDVEMSVLYNRLKQLIPMGARGDLESAQTTWLKRRGACGGDDACLSKAYADRLLQLRSAFDQLAARGPF
jgi:uncharacterized protein